MGTGGGRLALRRDAAPQFNVDHSSIRETIATLAEPHWVVDVPAGEWMVDLSAADERGETVAALFGELTFVVPAPTF